MALPGSADVVSSAGPLSDRSGIEERSESDSPPAGRLTTRDLGRPIRVVVFGGAFLEPAAQQFVALLDGHPEVELVGGFCQSRGFDLWSRIADVGRRRGLAAPLVLGVYTARAVLRCARRPRSQLILRQRVRKALTRFTAAPDIHSPAVLQRVRALAPDLGLVYGAPILKPQLFEIPTFGTLGIHHGKLPEYRGKKTTFWAVLNGEVTAGVTIQLITAGLDRGHIVRAGEVPIAGKRYGRAAAEVQELGLRLYMDAVLAVKRGIATLQPQPHGASPLYRQPAPQHYLRLWYRQATRLQAGR